MLAVTSDWELDVERGPDWLLVKVKDLGKDPTPALFDGLWDLLQRHLTYRLVLELDQIAVLDSHLIGQLIRLYKRICEHDGVLRLCGLSVYNLRVVQTCRLEGHFPPYRDREDAVLGRCRPRQPR